MLKRHGRLLRGSIWISLGAMWIGGCVTDLQFRDFLTTTLVRTFWQTVGTALQAGIVGTAN